MIIELTVLYCPTCRRDSIAEAPPCADGHDERCPDRACVTCGTALLFDAPLVLTTTADSRSRHAA